MKERKVSDAIYSKKLIKVSVLAVVAVFFALALYWATIAVIDSLGYISDAYTFQQLSAGPLWWMIVYYSGEGVIYTIGLCIRAAGSFFALFATVLFFTKKQSALPQVKRYVGVALLLEAVYFLSLIPSSYTPFSYFFAGGNLYYFGHTPGLIMLYVAAIPSLEIITVIPAALLKLRSKIIHNTSSQDIIKWSCIAAFAYLVIVFWFSYSMAWLGNMVPFGRAQGQYGWAFLLVPVNFASFIVTVVGLFLICLLTLKFIFPALRGKPEGISPSGIGAVMIAFGGYFVFSLLYYYLTGGYPPHPNVWYEMIGPLHNVNLWCLSLLFPGIAILLSIRKNKKSAKKH